MARRTVVGLLVFMLLLLLRSTASGQLLGSRWDWAMARIRPRSLIRSFLLLFLLLLLLLLRMPLLLLLFLLLLLLCRQFGRAASFFLLLCCFISYACGK